MNPVAERKVDSTPVAIPVFRHLTEVPVIPETLIKDSKEKKNASAL